MTAEISRRIATFTPNAETKIEIIESDDFYTILFNGRYAASFNNDGPAGYTAANQTAFGMVKMAEMIARAAEDAKIQRDFEAQCKRAEARAIRKARREADAIFKARGL